MEYELDRPHKFQIGDVIKHVDSPDKASETLEVIALSVRVVGGRAYPTYTLLTRGAHPEELDDVLCTVDLRVI